MTTSTHPTVPSTRLERIRTSVVRNARRLGLVLAGGALVASAGATVALTAPADSAVAPPTASAGENKGRIINQSGAPVDIWCDYGKPKTKHRLYEKKKAVADGSGGKQYDSIKFCPKDTDQFRSIGDGRCMTFGPDGYYLKPDKTYKIPGYSLGYIEAYAKGRCSKKHEWPLT